MQVAPDADFKLGTDAAPNTAAGAPRLAHGQPPITEEMRRNKNEVIRAAAARAGGTPLTPPAPLGAGDAETPPEPVVDYDSIEIGLPDGRVVLFGPPTGVATQLRVASLLGPRLNNYTSSLMRTLMSVREVSGVKIPPVDSDVAAQKVANLLGEQGVDLLQLALEKYWPPAKVSDLTVLKKNLR